MDNIQMVDLKSQYQRLKIDIDREMQEVIDAGAFINGPHVKKFAQELSQFLDCRSVIPCANGTDALQIAMMACGFRPEDQVIVPAFTYVATVEVIALLGLKPIFVDANVDDFNVNTTLLEEACTERTVGIVPVHLFGQCADMNQIMELAHSKNIKVIEDTAQAIGSVYSIEEGNSQYAGTIGDIGTTSFFPSKNLGCFGDGGAMMSNNEFLGRKAQMIANHGQSKKYVHDAIGVNSRLDTIQAAMLSVKLKELNDFANRRRIVADKYDLELRNLEDVVTPKRNANSTHVFHQYTLKIENGYRDALKTHLAEKGIPSMIYYPIPVPLQKAYAGFGFKSGQFPVTEKLCQSVLSLPIHTEMKSEQQDYIIEGVKSYFN